MYSSSKCIFSGVDIPAPENSIFAGVYRPTAITAFAFLRRTENFREPYICARKVLIFSILKRFCNNDYNLRRSVRYREIESLYLSLSGSGVPLILDLGANIGLSSLYFCKNWPLAKVVALEPERRNLETLLLNIKGIPSIDAIHAAISSHDGTVRITNPDDDAWGYRTQETAEGGGRFHQGDVCRFCYRNHRHKGSPPIPVYRENRY